ncbi:hypothetical protein B0H13DRAFT_1624914 [Mycena leptocephala]|nr:hypothetical protein B0H13DRAFT_1624914 [Mycena leptocephala]
MLDDPPREPSLEPWEGPPASVDPPPDTIETARAKRHIRLPRRYRDILPEVPPIENSSPAEENPPQSTVQRVRLIVRETFDTARNTFGLWRSYLHRPTYDPDSLISLNDLSNQFPPEIPDISSQPSKKPPYSSVNRSTSLLMSWQNNGHTTKSAGQLNSLVHDVLLDPKFNVEDLKGFDAERAEKQAEKDAADAFPLLKDFQTASVDIEVPSGSAKIPSRIFSVPGLYYRSLVTVIKAAFADPLSRHFHFTPFKLFHKVRSTAAQIRVFSEIYNSNAFIKEHDNVRLRGALPPDALDRKLEKIVAALMFWSDSTHLANFGTAKLWPIYMRFGNLSKYIRAKPSSGAEHHVAYIPSVSLRHIFTSFLIYRSCLTQSKTYSRNFM